MKATFPKLLLSLLLAASVHGFSSGSAVASTLEVVKFEAPWCGACRQMKPAFDKVASEFGDDAVFRSVNVDTQSAYADSLKIDALPTVIVFKNGKAVARQTGAMNAWRLRSLVRRHR